MNIIGHRNIYFVFSGFLVLTSMAAIAVWGLKLGIDFTGGSLLEVEFKNSVPLVEDIHKALASLGLDNILVQPSGERGVILRFKEIDEDKHQAVLKSLAVLAEKEGESGLMEKRFNAIGPTIGKELKNKSILALSLALAAIILYIAWAFRKVSRPVSSWKYGVAAVLALTHDVAIPLGVFAALGHFKGIEIDTLFITAILTVLGFSVHDTIVVFDRIRENLRKLKSPELFEVTVNRSVNETVGRSINTSFTVLLVLLAVFFLGGATTKYFALTLILGIIFGTYSSIFIASPIVVVWQKLNARKK